MILRLSSDLGHAVSLWLLVDHGMRQFPEQVLLDVSLHLLARGAALSTPAYRTATTATTEATTPSTS